jgi:polyhydroxybutyrate depolymerase
MRTARTPLALAIVTLVACVLALLVAIGAASAGIARAQKDDPGRGCLAELGAGDSWLHLWTAGRNREVLVHVPPSVGAGPAPLLVAVHGWASGAANFAAVTGLSAGADERGVVVAYPQGLGRPAGWHFAGMPSSEFGGRQSDVGLFDALLERLTVSGCVDPQKVFVAGHSQGGGMAAELACRRGEGLAGVAMISGEHFRLPCAPSRPVPILSLHAVDDEVLPYGGGQVTTMSPDFPSVLPAEEVAAAWAAIDGCLAAGREDHDDGVTRLTWSGCRAPVTFYRLSRGGHAWAGSGALAELSASGLVWSFVRPASGS